MPVALKIGGIDLPTPVMLAPMAGYTDLSFRLLVRDFGWSGLAFTEMLNPRSLLESRRGKIGCLLATAPSDRPLSYQIYGHEPEVMAEGAQWLAERGAMMIDINMGCPQKKIVRRGAGAGLLKDTRLAVAVARRVVEAVKTPVTVKIRLGWDDREHIAPALAAEFEQAGVAAVTVHGRTCRQRFGGEVDLNAIREVVKTVHCIPVIASGDVVSPRSARAMMERTGCAGIMIGRHALKEPWILRDASAELLGQGNQPRPTRIEHAGVMCRHLDLMTAQYGARAARILFRKWIPQYARGMPFSKQEMIRLIGMDDMQELVSAIKCLESIQGDGFEGGRAEG